MKIRQNKKRKARWYADRRKACKKFMQRLDNIKQPDNIINAVLLRVKLAWELTRILSIKSQHEPKFNKGGEILNIDRDISNPIVIPAKDVFK